MMIYYEFHYKKVSREQVGKFLVSFIHVATHCKCVICLVKPLTFSGVSHCLLLYFAPPSGPFAVSSLFSHNLLSPPSGFQQTAFICRSRSKVLSGFSLSNTRTLVVVFVNC